MDEIKITCNVQDRISYKNLIVIQGDLKSLSQDGYQKLKKSILKHGIHSPCYVWQDPNDGGELKLLDGTQRVRAYGQLEAEGYVIPNVPIVRIDAPDINMAKQILLTLVSQYGKIEAQGLYEYALEAGINIEQLHDFDFPDFDLGNFEAEFFKDEPVGEIEGEDEIPENVESRAKPAEIYDLDGHRLMVGDSTNPEHVTKLMDGKKAEICFTSPPYVDQRIYNNKELDLTLEKVASFIPASVNHINAFYNIVLGIVRKDKNIITYWDEFIKQGKDSDLKLLSWNIWNKGFGGSVGMANAMFTIDHEFIFVLGKDRKELNRIVPNKHAGEYANHSGVRNQDGTISKAAPRDIHSHRQLGTVIDCFGEKARNHDFDHPAMFPVKLPETYIEGCTDKGDIIYEPFCGSGTTIIAAEKTHRKCYAMEIDPHYADIIISRWEKFSGKKATLLGGA